MGLMTPARWAKMRADFAAVRDDNAVSIVIRRGNTTLPAQSVRIAGVTSMARIDSSDGSSQAVGRVTILGASDLNIQVGDRFTTGGNLYEVEFVHPNRQVKTQARAKQVQ